MIRHYIQLLYIDSRDEKRQFVIEQESLAVADQLVSEILERGAARIVVENCIEFIPLHRIVLIRIASEKD